MRRLLICISHPILERCLELNNLFLGRAILQNISALIHHALGPIDLYRLITYQ